MGHTKEPRTGGSPLNLRQKAKKTRRDGSDGQRALRA
jgi:hypothetical protein